MLLLRITALMMIVAGGATYVVGSSSETAGSSLTVTAAVLVVSGIGMLVLAQLLSPIMKTSKEMAERRGMKLSRLTGAPTMRSGMAVAGQTMAAAQQQMRAVMGDASLRDRGVPGQATVKAARATGETRNLNPVYDVDLMVMPDNGQAYNATVRTEVNSLAVAQCVPGTRVPVKADPVDPTKLWVDWVAVAGGAGAAGSGAGTR